MRCALSDEEDVHEQLFAALQQFMENVPDPQFAIYILRTATHAIIHEAASNRPEILDRPDFVPEVVALLETYLRRPL